MSKEAIVFRPRARSTPSSQEHGLERKSVSGAWTSKGTAGIEVQIFETKSCEALAKQRQRFCAKLSRHSLYREALYTGTHMLGKPSMRFPATQEDILTYVQVSFAKNVQEQIDLIDQIAAEPFPLTIVNVGIQRADNLASRDKNGLSDPYCLISVETDESMSKVTWRSFDFGSPKKPKTVKVPKNRERSVAEKRFDQFYSNIPRSIRTTIQHQTLNPVWEERFQCLALRPSHDILHIEVWDHDDEEEVVQSFHGATNAQKTEIVEEGHEILNAEFRGRGKQDDFIGKATYKVTEIPVEGLEQWFYLEGKTHRGAEAQGKILIQLWLTHTYRHGVHYTPEASPRAMLETLWDYVLDVEAHKRSVAGESWDGNIPPAATCLLFQYGLQTGLSESTQAIVRFNSYAKHHLQMHGTQVSLRELDCSTKKYGLSDAAAHAHEKLNHCDKEEMLDILMKSLREPFNVVRTHFYQKQDKVDEGLRAVRHVENILHGMGAIEQLNTVETEVKVALRHGVQQWYQETLKEYVKGPPEQNRTQIICGLAQVVGLVNRKLVEGQHRWHHLFSLESNVDYLQLIYDEFQKGIINDVEGTTAGLAKEIGDNDQQRKILLRMSPEHKALCVCLFELYAQTHLFVQFQDEVFSQSFGHGPKSYTHLDSFHEWFRPVLVLWLGFAFIKAHQMLSNSITSDDGVIDGSQLTSHSALETVFIFHQLANFVKELNWPDAAESSVVNMFIVEVMAYVSILYAKLKRRKIQKEGYFDRVGRFDISERLCTALNNIHYVQETVQKLPKELGIDQLLHALSETVGGASETVKKCHSRIINCIVNAVNHIEMELQEILAGVAHRIRPEIRAAWDAALIFLKSNPNDANPLAPLLEYLEPNLQSLHKFLLHANFVRMLHAFWLVICQELIEAAVAIPIESTVAQQMYFRHFQSHLDQLVAYLKGNGEGLRDLHLQLPQFKNAVQVIQLLTLSSDHVMKEYFHDIAMKQQDSKDKGHFGSLRLRVFATERKLHVEVISAEHLVPVDHPSPIWDVCSKIKTPSSDPQVEIDLLVNGQPASRVRKTRVQKKNLNPKWEESFEFFLDKDGLELESWTRVIVRFTVKDVDLISNDFMGEVLVPLDKMPGVTSEKPKAQPMTLSLREGGDLKLNPHLMVLNTRKWEVDTRQFVADQSNRKIIPA